jgi:UDPglucose 6-dehydrogenase
MVRTAVIGGGYVGLVSSACLASLGHSVTCIEIDKTRLERLEAGDLPIFEPGLDDLVAAGRREGRLTFTDDYRAAIPSVDFVFIAVNTPQAEDGNADTSNVLASVRSIHEAARPGLTLVIKSTVPVGTGDEIGEFFREAGLDVSVASNPEFLRQGTAIRDFLEPDRIVIGTSNRETARRVSSLFAAIDAPIIYCSQASAELAKYAANAFLAARISFINEISMLCDEVQADVMEVAEIVGTDARIGRSYLTAGLGWGGSCFPKDVQALAFAERSRALAPMIADAVYQVNQLQRDRALALVSQNLGSLTDKTVGVLGLAFKPDTDDLREAPAVDIIRRLLAEGARIKAHDPVATRNAMQVLPAVCYVDDPHDVASDADFLILATEWPIYQELNWSRIRKAMRRPYVLDGRQALNRSLLQDLGFEYLALGRTSAPVGEGGEILDA